jgi:hypothetical protein
MKPDPITVLWTSIPAGLQGRRARPVLSVLVSPRLRSADGSPALLADFAPFVDWPATVAALLPSMRVQFAGGAELPVTPLDPNVLESDLWRAVFPADATAVRAFEPDDWSKHSVLTYGVVQGLQGLQNLYGATAAQFSSGPPIARHHDFRRLVLEIAGGNSQERLVDALDKAVDFHKPRPAAHAGEPWPEPADLAGLLDFHTLVSSLGDHPRLLRALGLVIDLVLPEAAPRSFAPTLLCVRPHFRNSDLCPRTLAELDPERFAAVPHEPARWGGLLPMKTEDFALVDVDVDGALLKLDGLRKVLGERARLPAPDAALTAAGGCRSRARDAPACSPTRCSTRTRLKASSPRARRPSRPSSSSAATSSTSGTGARTAGERCARATARTPSRATPRSTGPCTMRASCSSP